MGVSELVRRNGISEASFYNWQARYGNLDVSMLWRLKWPHVEQAVISAGEAAVRMTIRLRRRYRFVRNGPRLHARDSRTLDRPHRLRVVPPGLT